MPGILAFSWVQLALTLVARRLALRFVRAPDPALALLAGLLAFVAVAELVLLVLGAMGWLHPLAQVVAVTGIALAERAVPLRRGAWPVSLPARREGAGSRVLLALLLGLCAWWVLSTAGSGTRFVWDDLTYHAAIPAAWLQSGSLAVPPLTYQAYYPANAELLTLWFLLPVGHDGFANLAVLAWVLLLVAAGTVLARRLGHPPALARAALAAVLVSSGMRFFAGTFSANDLAIAGLGAAALALAVPSTGRIGAGRAGACGVAAGLALGTKVSMATLVVWAALPVLFALRRPGGARAAASFAVGAAVFGLPWYVRNVALTGNPLFPAQMGPFEGPFTGEAQRTTSLAPWIAAGWASPEFWGELAGKRLDWPLPLGIGAVLGFAAGLVAVRRERDARRRMQLVVVLGAGLTFLLLFPLQPFSGTINRPESPLHPFVRYLAFPFALGWMLLPAGTTGRPLATGVLLAATLLAGAAAGTDLSPGGAAVVVLGGPLLLLAVCAPLKRDATAQRILDFGTELRPLDPGWQALWDLPAGTRVATLTHDGSSHLMHRPLFGPGLELVPVTLNQDGTARARLHESWRDEPDDWWWELKPRTWTTTLEDFMANLRGAGVEFLLVQSWPRSLITRPVDLWPQARRLLANGLDPSRRLFKDSYSVLWDVRAPLSVDELRRAAEWREKWRRGEVR